MTDETPTQKLPGRVSKSTAALILQKAADLDAVGDEMIELEELRQAALDAGISTRAFDLSLAELRSRRAAAAGTPPPPRAAKAPPRPAVAYMGVLGAGTVAGTAALGFTAMIAPGVPGDAVIGALIGGGGMMLGVLAYLRLALGRGGRD
jgi:hypothetical protein